MENEIARKLDDIVRNLMIMNVHLGYIVRALSEGKYNGDIELKKQEEKK